MSLIAFHKFLITTGILFCLGFALRQLSEFQLTGDNGTLITAIGFGIAALAMGFYLRHLRDILKIPPQRAGLGPSKPRSGNLADNFLGPTESLGESHTFTSAPAFSANAGTKLWRWVSSLTKRKTSASEKNGHVRQESGTEEE